MAVKQFLETVAGLIFFAVSLHWVIGGMKAGKLLGRFIARSLRAPLIPYYSKKAIQRFQRARKDQGLPPLENENLL
jgi:hypothetical protein